MEKRRFGRTGHLSSVAIFGAASLSRVSQQQAEQALNLVIDSGVNHIDVAPSYGEAEQRLGPLMPRFRSQFFLGCKTLERSRSGAETELQQSRSRLQTDYFDLYQLHAITSLEDLNQVTQSGGALEAAIAAREQGLVRYIGLTGHGHLVAEVFLEALRRFDFDSLLFPINPYLYSLPAYRRSSEELLQACSRKDIGTMIIKTAARGPWKEQPKNYTTWYQPFDGREEIQAQVDFTLSQPVSGLCTPGDLRILALFLQSCERFSSMYLDDQQLLIEKSAALETIF